MTFIKTTDPMRACGVCNIDRKENKKEGKFHYIPEFGRKKVNQGFNYSCRIIVKVIVRLN